MLRQSYRFGFHLLHYRSTADHILLYIDNLSPFERFGIFTYLSSVLTTAPRYVEILWFNLIFLGPKVNANKDTGSRVLKV